ncbi:MAG TPA: cytochrome c [Vicinamibacterales bacterium]|nr:cytochrome c [Vicinamibacterales bacterium]
MRTAWITIGIGTVGGLFIASPTVFGRTAQKPVAAAVARGEATFRDHCAACHGSHGKGDGPVAGALTPRPTDLAGLTKRTGTFPAAQLTAALKGTDPVLAHGDSTMRIWGAFFSADANGDPKRADRRISDIVEFIKSIQEK